MGYIVNTRIRLRICQISQVLVCKYNHHSHLTPFLLSTIFPTKCKLINSWQWIVFMILANCSLLSNLLKLHSETCIPYCQVVYCQDSRLIWISSSLFIWFCYVLWYVVGPFEALKIAIMRISFLNFWIIFGFFWLTTFRHLV